VEEFIKITKAMSDPNRVRALMALRKKELCVCQITELLKLAPSTVSKHMAILKEAGLIKSRKDERWVYYSLPDNQESTLIKKNLEWVMGSVAYAEDIEKDNVALSKILRQDREKLCKRQRKKC
jgi:DNA-binding transcriptional ArsR family regulator